MHTVPVLLLLAGAVILVGVVAVAMGHGGEMAEFPSDYVPPTLGDLATAADVAMLRPPSALWGYNTQVTDEALTRIAQIVTERDVEIAVLRQQLAAVRPDGGAPPRPPAPEAEPEAESAGVGVGVTGPAPHGVVPAEPAAGADRGSLDADAELPAGAAPVQAAQPDEAAAPGDG